MREVHADRCRFFEDGVQALRGALGQFGADAQGVIGRVSGAEHPLVAAHGADAAPHLVGQRLKRQAAIGGGQGARDGGTGSLGGLDGREDSDGLFEAALEQGVIAGERNKRTRAAVELIRQVKAVNRIEEKQRAHALIKVVTGAAKSLERCALGEQLLRRRGAAECVVGAVSHLRVGGGDDVD